MQLSIQNFEALAEATVDVTGITLVRGPSHNGKSSLCRAFETWLLGDQGDDYIRFGSDECSLRGTLGTHRLERVKKTGGSVRYTVNGTTYSKLGKSGHWELVKPLGIARLQAGTTTLDLNVIRQFDPLFFVGLTGPQKFAVVQLVLAENKLPDVLKDVAGSIKVGNQRLDVLTELIKNAQQRETGLEQRRDQLGRVLERVAPVVSQTQQLAQRWQTLTQLRGILEQRRQQWQTAKARQQGLHKADMAQATVQLEQAQALWERYSRWQRLAQDRQRTQQNQHRWQQRVTQLRQISTAGLLDALKQACERHQQLRRGQISLQNARQQVQQRQANWQAVKDALPVAVSAVKEQQQLLTTCPYCRSVLDENHRHALLTCI